MILLTDELREQLFANGRQRDADHVPKGMPASRMASTITGGI